MRKSENQNICAGIEVINYLSFATFSDLLDFFRFFQFSLTVVVSGEDYISHMRLIKE